MNYGDINTLATALRTGGKATADLRDLEAQMKGARALENTARPEARSILSGLVANMDRQRGREQVADLSPRLAKARAIAAENAGAEALYNAATSAEKEQYDRQWQEGANDRALSLARAKYDMRAGEARPGKYKNVNTGDVATLNVNSRTGQLMLDGQPVKGSDWVAYERPLSSGSGSGSGSGAEEHNGGGMIGMLEEAFSDEFANPAFGLPFAGEISNTLSTEAPAAATKDMKDRQNWWGNFERFWSMPIRHDMFGSALTNTEKAIWRSASINPNMDADTIRAKLRIMRDVYEGKYKNADYNPFAENKPSNYGLRMPSGVSEDEWNELDEAEQREYIERFGN